MFLRILAFLLALSALPAAAQQEMEILPLRNQTVERVLPALRPLLEPGASLSGMNGQLFLRASPRNREEVKRALAAIDTPLRRLLIRVALDRNAEEGGRGAAAGGEIALGTRSRANAEARVWDTRSARSENAGQMVQTVEGGSAFIQVGRSLPVPMRQIVLGRNGAVLSETVVYRDLAQGFHAVPQLNGERVTLEISQGNDTPGRYGPGSVDSQRLATTVSGRLGEWMELGGSGRRAAGVERGGINLSTGDVREQRSIWLKVEEIQ